MLKSFKNKTIISIITLTALILIGCSGGIYKTIMSTEKNTSNSMQMTYLSFEGYKYKTFNLKNGDELNLNIEVTTKEGALKISLIDENSNELFNTENPKESIAKTIKAEKDTNYTLKVEGKHKGSYKITWDIEHSQGGC